MKTLDQGCSTTLVAALDPVLDICPGVYLSDGDVQEPERPDCLDPEEAEKLWNLSEKIVGEKFSY
jgi:hypothetical protein